MQNIYDFKVKTRSGMDTHEKCSRYQIENGGDLVLYRADGTYETINGATIRYSKGEWLKVLRSDHRSYREFN